jgi:hypothetical protein
VRSICAQASFQAELRGGFIELSILDGERGNPGVIDGVDVSEIPQVDILACSPADASDAIGQNGGTGEWT